MGLMQMPLNTSFAELANGAFAVASLYTNLFSNKGKGRI